MALLSFWGPEPLVYSLDARSPGLIILQDWKLEDGTMNRRKSPEPNLGRRGIARQGLAAAAAVVSITYLFGIVAGSALAGVAFVASLVACSVVYFSGPADGQG